MTETISIPLTLETLSAVVTDRNASTSRPDWPYEFVQRTYLELCHHHIPKLEDAGTVHCNWTEGTITVAGDSESLLRLLEDITE